MSSPKEIKASELSIIRMVAGNERKYQAVIEDGKVKEWVGIGWITVRDASEEDYETIPKVV